MTKNKVARFNQRAVEQFNGREGETATFLFSLSCFPHVARIRFRPTSSQPLDASLKKDRANAKNNEWLCARRKDNSIVGDAWFPATPRLTSQ
jgi:hypothetical protein